MGEAGARVRINKIFTDKGEELKALLAYLKFTDDKAIISQVISLLEDKSRAEDVKDIDGKVIGTRRWCDFALYSIWKRTSLPIHKFFFLTWTALPNFSEEELSLAQIELNVSLKTPSPKYSP